jgi:hypothetical protein
MQTRKMKTICGHSSAKGTEIVPSGKSSHGKSWFFNKNKTKDFSFITPLNRNTYIYNSEKDYYADYSQARFGVTLKKAGWDCMRHYEILANGCIPFFIDIEKCPINTMKLCPKDLFIEANALYTKFKCKNIHELTKNDLK